MFRRTGERHEDMLLGQRFTPQNSEVRKHLIRHVGFAFCFDLETSTNTEKEIGVLEGCMSLWLLVLFASDVHWIVETEDEFGV